MEERYAEIMYLIKHSLGAIPLQIKAAVQVYLNLLSSDSENIENITNEEMVSSLLSTDFDYRHKFLKI